MSIGTPTTFDSSSSTALEAPASTTYPDVSPSRHAPSSPLRAATPIRRPFIPLMPPSFIMVTPFSDSDSIIPFEVAAPYTLGELENDPVMYAASVYTLFAPHFLANFTTASESSYSPSAVVGWASAVNTSRLLPPLMGAKYISPFGGSTVPSSFTLTWGGKLELVYSATFFSLNELTRWSAASFPTYPLPGSPQTRTGSFPLGVSKTLSVTTPSFNAHPSSSASRSGPPASPGP